LVTALVCQPIVEDGAHEFVGDADRVVRVLEEHRTVPVNEPS
jgi:hypothetical protein